MHASSTDTARDPIPATPDEVRSLARRLPSHARLFLLQDLDGAELQEAVESFEATGRDYLTFTFRDGQSGAFSTGLPGGPLGDILLARRRRKRAVGFVRGATPLSGFEACADLHQLSTLPVPTAFAICDRFDA